MGIRTVLASVALVAATVAPGAAQQADADPVAAMRSGRELFEKSCKLCHGLDRSLATNRDAAAWAVIVKRMVAYGSPLNAEQRPLVVRYLAARSTFAGTCGSCHELTRVVGDKPGARDWKALAERMAGHALEAGKPGTAATAGSFSPEALTDIAALLQVVIP
jgi:mono/diheme cytochrome c family protein